MISSAAEESEEDDGREATSTHESVEWGATDVLPLGGSRLGREYAYLLNDASEAGVQRMRPWRACREGYQRLAWTTVPGVRCAGAAYS
jgi:hypothetical protein